MRKPSTATVGIVLTALFGIPTWWALFIEHPETLGAIQRIAWTVLRLLSPLIMMACGGLVGWGLAKRRTANQMEAKDKRIAELEKRPTKDDLDALAAKHAKQLAAKDAEIARLQERLEGGKPTLLTGEQALNFIRMLTDNQKKVLAYFYESGGSAEADPLDAELHALKDMNLMWMPDYSIPGIPAKWTMPLNVYQIIRNHPDVLDGFLGEGDGPEDANGQTVASDPLEAEALEAFRAICSTCYYDESFSMVEPVVFSLEDEELRAIGLSERGVRLAEEYGLVRIEGKSGWLPVDEVFKGEHPGLSFEPDPAHDNERGVRMVFKGFGKLVRPPIFEKELPSGKRDLKECIRLGIVRFTVRGREKAACVDAEESDSVRDYIDRGMR